MTRRLLGLAATVALAAGVVAAAPASACTQDACPRGPLCPYVRELCLNPF